MMTTQREDDWGIEAGEDWFEEPAEPEWPGQPTQAQPRPPGQPPTQPSMPEPPSHEEATHRQIGLVAALVAVTALVLGGIFLARELASSDEATTLPEIATTLPATLPATTVPTTTPVDTTPATTAPGSTAPAATTPTTTTPAPVSTEPLSVPLPEDITLRRGEEGDSVVAVQEALLRLGYEPGSADGKFGASTEAAVIAFQQAAGLEADGVVGPATLAALRSALESG